MVRRGLHMEIDGKTRAFIIDGPMAWERYPEKTQLSQMLLGKEAQEVFERADVSAKADNRGTTLRYNCTNLRTDEDFVFDYSGQDIRERHRLLSGFIEERYGPGLTVLVG
jgi:hypothetical protein